MSASPLAGMNRIGGPGDQKQGMAGPGLRAGLIDGLAAEPWHMELAGNVKRVGARERKIRGAHRRTKRLVVCFALLAIIFVFAYSPSPASALSNADAIIERSVQANAADWAGAPAFDYFERDQQPGGGSKTYEELMIMGSPYEKLVAVNGKPISPEQQEQEQQRLDAAISRRRNESERAQSERIAIYEKDRKRDHALMEQLTKAFDFALVGRQAA